MSDNPVGVIGAGSFGTTVANLLAENSKVLLYARSNELFNQMLTDRKSRDYSLHENVTPVQTIRIQGYDAHCCSLSLPISYPNSWY